MTILSGGDSVTLRDRKTPLVGPNAQLSSFHGASPSSAGDPRRSLADHAMERGLLGRLLISAPLIPQTITAGLAAASFASPGHAAAFSAMQRLGPELVLARPYGAVVDEMSRAGDLRLIGGAAGIVRLLIDALEPHLVGMAVERLVVLARARTVARVLRQALDRVDRDPTSADTVLAGLRGVR